MQSQNLIEILNLIETGGRFSPGFILINQKNYVLKK